MYYLQSRYYDPAIGRFINADTFATTDADGFLSCNMFAYCENDPVNRIDTKGETGVFIAFNFAIGAVAGAVGQIAANLITGNCWHEGVLGAAVGGGVYNTVALLAKNTAIASVAASAAEATVNEISTYFCGKPLTKDNLKESVGTIASNAGKNAVAAGLTGKFAGKIVPTNSGWFQPQKLISCFTGKFGQKVIKQTAVQAIGLTTVRTIDHYARKMLKSK